jgi:hypothetical protein
MAISFCEMVNCKVTGLGTQSWEVPFATIRHGYFETVMKIMKTGFPYPKLEARGMDGGGPDVDKMVSEEEYLKKEYPNIAYFEWCKIMQKDIEVLRETSVDHPESVQTKRNKDGEEEEKDKSLEEYLVPKSDPGADKDDDAAKENANDSKKEDKYEENSNVDIDAVVLPRKNKKEVDDGDGSSKSYKIAFTVHSGVDGTHREIGDIVVEVIIVVYFEIFTYQ